VVALDSRTAAAAVAADGSRSRGADGSGGRQRPCFGFDFGADGARSRGADGSGGRQRPFDFDFGSGGADGSRSRGADGSGGRRRARLRRRFFKNFECSTASYTHHNAALKWFRLQQEKEHNAAAKKFSRTRRELVPEIVKDKGMAYEFNERVRSEWSWVEMVAQLDDQSIAHVVKGDRSGGL